MSAYMELYKKFRDDIVSGVYKYGEKLPSKRTVAADAEVSVITVQHAYELLNEEGYIESRERSGFFVVYKEADFLGKDVGHESRERRDKHEKRDARDSTNVSFNILAKTMRKVLLDYGEQILVKSPNSGLVELREEIRAYLARNRGIHVDVNQIVIGSGAEYFYSLLAELFDEAKVIAVEDPSYEKIRKVYQTAGHEIDALKLGSDGILSAELAKTKAGVLHVTPFHSYPSNITADISKKNEYIKWAGDSRYIVEDNYDSELTVSRKMEDALFALADGKRVIYINTFSKTIAPSMRIGYMILPQELLARFDAKFGFFSCTVPVFEQYVLCELLRSGDFERHVNRVRRQRRKQ